jgi:hypothetical protein
MKASQVPAKFNIPFANNAGAGFIRNIPQAHSSTPGAASLYDGFPPACFQAPEAGGVPPFGQDFNGIMYWATAAIQFQQAGGWPTYDAAFSAQIGGYPNRAMLVSADGTHFWKSTVDDNTSNPDTGGANWTVLQPGSYPWGSITGAPDFVQRSEFTGSNQSTATNGYQKFPGGKIEQECDVFVSGAVHTTVTVTYPLTFPTSAKAPVVSVVDPSESAVAGNFLGLSIISFNTAGCVVALDANGGGGRDVTLHVEVVGR